MSGSWLILSPTAHTWGEGGQASGVGGGYDGCMYVRGEGKRGGAHNMMGVFLGGCWSWGGGIRWLWRLRW